MLGVKTDKAGNTLIKVLCRGCPRHMAFWTSKMSLLGKDVDAMIQTIPKKAIIVRKKPLKEAIESLP